MKTLLLRALFFALFVSVSTIAPRAQECIATDAAIARAAADGVRVDSLSAPVAARARAIYGALPPATPSLPDLPAYVFTFASGALLVGFEVLPGQICAHFTVPTERAGMVRRALIGEGI